MEFSGATSATLSITGAVATDTGSYTVVVTNTGNLVVTSTTSSAGNLIMNLAPVITTQPHDTTIVTGGSASFTVAATGSGTLSYQWKKNGSNVSGGQFSGQTTATLSITGAVATDTGAYTVVVTNTRNLVVTSTTSSAGNLIMNLAPVITTQPHDTTIVTGGSASFTVAATGSGTLSYQWKKNGTNVSGGQFSGETTATLSITGAVATDTGAYTVVVSNTRNIVVTSTTSSAGNLIMNLAPVITTQPHDTTIVTGGSASFTVAATGSGTLSYQWKKNGTNVSGVQFSGQTTATLSITGAVATDTGAYTVVVTNTRNSVVTSTTSSAGNLIMNLAPSSQRSPMTRR